MSERFTERARKAATLGHEGHHFDRIGAGHVVPDPLPAVCGARTSKRS